MRNLSSRHAFVLFLLLSLALVVAAGALQASPGGRSGVSQSTFGCSCHSTIPNQNGAVTVLISGPQQLAPGTSGSYTVSVSGGPTGTTGGFDLSASGGTFTAGTNDKVLNSDMTHASANGRSWTFSWQAPSTPGTYNFYAVGQATNGSGTDGDSWNWYGGAVSTPFAITVGTAGVEGGVRSDLWLAPAWPNPAAGSVRLAFSLATAGPARLEILDAAGRRVSLLWNGATVAGRHEVFWRSRDDGGRRVPSGTYFARLSAGGSVLRTTIHLAR